MTPSPRRPRRLLPGLALLAAACAGTPPASPEEAEAATVLRAFFHVCGRLQPGEVERRGRGLGFVPVDPARLPARPAAGAQVMARPPAEAGGVAALLVWNDSAPSCEMAVSGVAPEAAERAFGRMIDALAAQPAVQVRPVPLPAGGVGNAPGLPLRRMVLLLAQGQVPPQPHLVLLRTAEAPAPGRVAAIFSVAIGRPVAGGGGAATPPPASALQPPDR